MWFTFSLFHHSSTRTNLVKNVCALNKRCRYVNLYIFKQWEKLHEFKCSLLHCSNLTQPHAIIKLSTKCQNCFAHLVFRLLLCYWGVSAVISRGISISEWGNSLYHMCSCWSVYCIESWLWCWMNTETVLSVVAGFTWLAQDGSFTHSRQKWQRAIIWEMYFPSGTKTA